MIEFRENTSCCDNDIVELMEKALPKETFVATVKYRCEPELFAGVTKKGTIVLFDRNGVCKKRYLFYSASKSLSLIIWKTNNNETEGQIILEERWEYQFNEYPS